jgi:hypothetical protein
MILTFLACNPLPETVAMSGVVWDAPYLEGAPVAGAALQVFDEYGEVWGEAESTADGAFQVDVPAGVPFFTTVSGDGRVPTAFSGTAGISDFIAPEGFPWVADAAWMDALRVDFAACPTVNELGAVVAGQVALDGSYEVILTASARVYAADGSELAACYLDDDGESTADATVTGATGRFAVFGVPPGEIVVDVRYDVGLSEQPVKLFWFFAPEGGLVPMYPTLMDLP